MSEPQRRPTELKALCVALLIWSALSFAGSTWWANPRVPGGHTVNLDFGAFAFLAAVGLWRRSPAGRTLALVFTWYWLIGSVLLFFQLFPVPGITVTSESNFLTKVPKAVLRVFVVPFFCAQVWQYRVLTRPRIRELFLAPRWTSAK